jgi:hypothetical protein
VSKDRKQGTTVHFVGAIPAAAGAVLPIVLPGITVRLTDSASPDKVICTDTDDTGTAQVSLAPGTRYLVDVRIGRAAGDAFQYSCDPMTLDASRAEYTVRVPMNDLQVGWALEPDSAGTPFDSATVFPYGRNVFLMLSGPPLDDESVTTTVSANGATGIYHGGTVRRLHSVFTSQTGRFAIHTALGGGSARFLSSNLPMFETTVLPPTPTMIEGGITVGMRRTASRYTEDVPLWVRIRKGTDALSFTRYLDFMDWLFCNDQTMKTPASVTSHPHLFDRPNRHQLPFTDTDAYRNIKFATEAFVMANCGVFDEADSWDADYVVNQVGIPGIVAGNLNSGFDHYEQHIEGTSEKVLPYLAIIRRKFADQGIKEHDIGSVLLSLSPKEVNTCYGLLRHKLTCPCLLELIWSYWQEEGMLVQTMNVLTRRFQNIRSDRGNDPLANLEIDPLRPLNNLIWGYIQDEQHRLSVVRRNYEYDHHYGLRLAGLAVREPRTADSRSKLLEAYHTLLSIISAFYKRDDDTTIVADGFPVLNALKETHLILTQAMQNQYGDLPSTARIEMLMQQWILGRPEFREFLPTRIMVALPEPWMDRVDAMKKVQGWTDTSVLHFRNLAVFGEQILLSIRFGAWANVNDPYQASNWARYWRPEIQGYMHAYRSVTGVDLTVDVTNARIDATMPSVHLVQRLADQRRVA